MALQENILVYTGNRVSVEMNNHEVGLCQSLRANDNYNLQAASGIGDIHVLEWVPTQAIHQLSVQTMILYRDKITSAGDVSSLQGAFEGNDIMENGDAVLRGLTFDIVVHGKAPKNFVAGSTTYRGISPLSTGDLNKVVRHYKGCTFESGDVDVRAHQIIIQNANFRALDVEKDPGVPDRATATTVPTPAG
jgi:hypothetical protein